MPHALVFFKAQLGEPFLGILIFFFSSFSVFLLFFPFFLLALKTARLALKTPKTGT